MIGEGPCRKALESEVERMEPGKSHLEGEPLHRAFRAEIARQSEKLPGERQKLFRKLRLIRLRAGRAQLVHGRLHAQVRGELREFADSPRRKPPVEVSRGGRPRLARDEHRLVAERGNENLRTSVSNAPRPLQHALQRQHGGDLGRGEREMNLDAERLVAMEQGANVMFTCVRLTRILAVPELPQRAHRILQTVGQNVEVQIAHPAPRGPPRIGDDQGRSLEPEGHDPDFVHGDRDALDLAGGFLPARDRLDMEFAKRLERVRRRQVAQVVLLEARMDRLEEAVGCG